MDRELSELRRAVSDAGPRGPGRRLPTRLQARLVEVIRRRHARGESLRQLAEALGLTAETLRRWLAAAPSTAPAVVRPLPVAVVEPIAAAAAPLALVTPDGFRFEGLTVASAAELLARLR